MENKTPSGFNILFGSINVNCIGRNDFFSTYDNTVYFLKDIMPVEDATTALKKLKIHFNNLLHSFVEVEEISIPHSFWSSFLEVANKAAEEIMTNEEDYGGYFGIGKHVRLKIVLTHNKNVKSKPPLEFAMYSAGFACSVQDPLLYKRIETSIRRFN